MHPHFRQNLPRRLRFGNRLALGIGSLMVASGLNAADYFPLAGGNSWIYQDSATGSTFQVRVGMTQLFANDHVYHSLRGYAARTVWVRVNEHGNIVFLDEDQQSEPMLTAFETGFGGWFDAGARQCPEMGQAQEQRMVHDGPGGKWSALEILYRSFGCADAGDISEQFAENIGMVRRVVNTIAGPRTYNLIQARVGTQSITVGNTGSFRVTVLPNQDASQWNVALRFEQSPGNGVKVRFPTSQEYDVRVRDQEGNILFTWSADKIFLQTEHGRTLSGSWTETVNVPVPPGIPELQRSFVIEGWLTTADGEPRFAAAATVTVPGVNSTTAAVQ